MTHHNLTKRLTYMLEPTIKITIGSYGLPTPLVSIVESKVETSVVGRAGYMAGLQE